MPRSKKHRYNFTLCPDVKKAAALLACSRNTTLSALIESLLAREVQSDQLPRQQAPTP